MSKSILEALFYGRINPWECRAVHSPEREEIEKRIKAEKSYFKESLSNDDFQRLESLESLYTQASEDEEIAAFSYGFTMGTLILLEVLACQEDAYIQQPE